MDVLAGCADIDTTLVTVSVAVLLVVLEADVLESQTHRYCHPLYEQSSSTVSVSVVSPLCPARLLILVQAPPVLYCHWYVIVDESDTVAFKGPNCALVPAPASIDTSEG